MAVARTRRAPSLWEYHLPAHDFPYYWFKVKKMLKIGIYEFCNKLYTEHTVGRCLIRCVNIYSDSWNWKWHEILYSEIQVVPSRTLAVPHHVIHILRIYRSRKRITRCENIHPQQIVLHKKIIRYIRITDFLMLPNQEIIQMLDFGCTNISWITSKTLFIESKT